MTPDPAPGTMNYSPTQPAAPHFRGDLTYEPRGTVPATEHRQRDHKLCSTRRVECPTCGVLIAPGAVITHGKPFWHMDHECLVVHRSIYCDGCRHVMHWFEGARHTGPVGFRCTGEVLGTPGFSSGDDYIRRYLTANPQAQGVEQS